jgi:hypothetical protein
MFFNPSPGLSFPVLGSRHIKDGPDLNSAPSDKRAFGSPRLFSGLKQPAIRFRPSAQTSCRRGTSGNVLRTFGARQGQDSRSSLFRNCGDRLIGHAETLGQFGLSQAHPLSEEAEFPSTHWLRRLDNVGPASDRCPIWKVLLRRSSRPDCRRLWRALWHHRKRRNLCSSPVQKARGRLRPPSLVNSPQ